MVFKKWVCGSCSASVSLQGRDSPVAHTCSCGSKNWVFESIEFTPGEWEEEIKSFRPIYEEIQKIYKSYIDLPDEYIKLCSLWVMATYAIEAFSSFPFLFFNAPKSSGKTRTITLTSFLARGSKGRVYTGVNEVGLYRSEPYSTLVIDECEKITSKEAQSFREYLQASYKKSATVMRAVRKKVDNKEIWVMEEFKPFRPLLMANINGMDEVLGSRCINIPLQQSNNQNLTRIIEDFETNPLISQIVATLIDKQCSSVGVCRLKNTIPTWNTYISQQPTPTNTTTQTTLPTLPTLETLSEEDIKMFEKLYQTGINGRNLELIFPLVVMARIIGEDVFDEILPILLEIIEKKKAEDVAESIDISFLQFIGEQTSRWNEYTSINLLTQMFKEYIGWTTDQDWLNSMWLSRALIRLQLYSSKRRVARGVEVMLLPQRAKQIYNQMKGNNPQEPKQ